MYSTIVVLMAIAETIIAIEIGMVPANVMVVAQK